MNVGIVRFPGSNCDADVHRAVTEGLGQEATFLWHKSHDLGGVDVVVLPGGFSYGDYLRVGAIARFSPIMRDVIDFARSGGLTLGICNGFQVLCEARLLPGALVRNRGLRFRCIEVGLKVENAHVDAPSLRPMNARLSGILNSLLSQRTTSRESLKSMPSCGKAMGSWKRLELPWRTDSSDQGNIRLG